MTVPWAAIADQLPQENGIVVCSAKWYRKDHITFTDALAAVRRHIWMEQTFAMSSPDRHPEQMPPPPSNTSSISHVTPPELRKVEMRSGSETGASQVIALTQWGVAEGH